MTCAGLAYHTSHLSSSCARAFPPPCSAGPQTRITLAPARPLRAPPLSHILDRRQPTRHLLFTRPLDHHHLPRVHSPSFPPPSRTTMAQQPFKRPRAADDQSKKLPSNETSSSGETENAFSTIQSVDETVQRLALLKGQPNQDDLHAIPPFRFRKDGPAQGDVEHVFRMVSRVQPSLCVVLGVWVVA